MHLPSSADVTHAPWPCLGKLRVCVLLLCTGLTLIRSWGTAWGCSLPHACQKGPTVTLSLWAVFGKAYICGVNCLMVSCAPEFQIHHQFDKKDSSPSSPQSVTAACTTSLPLWPDRSALQASQVSSSCLSLFPVPVFIQKDLRSLSTPWCNPEHCKLLTQLFLKLTF